MAPYAAKGTDSPRELGAFLRARRGDLAPEAAGLDAVGNRRVRGLRREETAQLAMISTHYYTRLEQGRLASATEEVLDTLATAGAVNGIAGGHGGRTGRVDAGDPVFGSACASRQGPRFWRH